MTTAPGAGPVPGRRPRALAAVLLAIGVLATAIVVLGPRSVVVDGQVAVGGWLARHPTADGLVAALGGVQSAGNLLLFAPVAALLAATVAWRWSPVAFVLLGLAPLGAEVVQDVLPGRVPDLDDVLLNTVGLTIAFGAVLALRAVVAAVAAIAAYPSDMGSSGRGR